MYFWIFCDAVIGKMSMKWTYLGILNHEILSLQNACTSCSESVTPSAGIMNAAGCSPYFFDGQPTTATSLTPGMVPRKSSTSFGEMFSPPRIMRSLRRPVM